MTLHDIYFNPSRDYSYMRILCLLFMMTFLSSCAIQYQQPQISQHVSAKDSNSKPAILALQQLGITLQKIDGIAVAGEGVYLSPGQHQINALVKRTPNLSTTYGSTIEAKIMVESGHVYEIANVSNSAPNAFLVLLDKGKNYDVDCLFLRRLLYGNTKEMQNKCGNHVENGLVTVNTKNVEATDIAVPIDVISNNK